MSLMSRAAPSLWLAAATLAAMLPWGLDAGARLLPPLAVAAVIATAATRRAGALSVWAVLLCGIAYDCVTLGPIGFWALIWLTALAVATLLRPAAAGIASRVAAGTVAMAAAGALNWGLASVYQVQILPMQPYSSPAAVAILILLAVTLLAEFWTAGRQARPVGLKLERGA